MTSADTNTCYYLLCPFISSRLVLSTLFFSRAMGDGGGGTAAITKLKALKKLLGPSTLEPSPFALDFATNVGFTKVKAGLNDLYV